ncbi:MAG: GTP-binding protein HSR1, partial [Chloroflexi bacterium]|nr:GTP-binding protein HSR1 [Chloroflexota bacterium]
MPANLTPAYFEAEKRYRVAETTEEKLKALNEMLAVMPKHKGTEGLRAELRTKVAKLTKEATKEQATAKRGGVYHIPKEGAGQVVLIGFTNVGKSQLVGTVTSAVVEVADYPYTTKVPQVGMMKFDNTQIQLVDMPSINDQDARPWFATILRSTDALLLMVDLEIDPVTELQELLEELARYKIGLANVSAESEDIVFLKRGLIIGNKSDLDPEGANLAALKAAYRGKIPVVGISAKKSIGLDELRKEAFGVLGVIRVYTKSPGTRANLNDPMVLKAGSTIEDAAEAVHKDFRKN